MDSYNMLTRLLYFLVVDWELYCNMKLYFGTRGSHFLQKQSLEPSCWMQFSDVSLAKCSRMQHVWEASGLHTCFVSWCCFIDHYNIITLIIIKVAWILIFQYTLNWGPYQWFHRPYWCCFCGFCGFCGFWIFWIFWFWNSETLVKKWALMDAIHKWILYLL